MILRWLCLLIWLAPPMVRADTFQPTDVQRIQLALQNLGYPVGSLDGVWRDDTEQHLAQYRYDFGLPDTISLSIAEATDLVTRAQRVTAPPVLVWAETGSWSEKFITDDAEKLQYSPPRQLFASSRHALVMEMLARSRPYISAHTFDPIFKGWSEAERARARQWLKDDIRRIDAADPVGGLLGKTLLEIDLEQHLPVQPATRDGMDRNLFPRLRVLVDGFTEQGTAPDLYQGLTERLLATLLHALGRSACYDGRRIDPEWVEMALVVIGRYERFRPGAPELMGTAKALVPCADANTAERILTWRIAVAQSRNDSELAFDIGIERMQDAFNRQNFQLAKAQFDDLFAVATETQRQDLIERTPIRELGLKDIAAPYLIAQVDAMRGKSIANTADIAGVMALTSRLMGLNFDLAVIDRVFLETRNMWRHNGADLPDFYRLVIGNMLDSRLAADTLDPLDRLVDRAMQLNDPDAVADFLGFKIEALLTLGSFTEAERLIADFVSNTPNGVADTRVATWQARLNLAADEGRGPGVIYAEQFSEFLDYICRPDADFQDMPELQDRAAVYDDPGFLPNAAALELADRIAACRTDPYPMRTEGLQRLGCYLWAKDGNLVQLTVALQRWLADVQEADRRGNGVVLAGSAMDCPMGIAEAGRNDLLTQFMAQVDDSSTTDGIVLLKLATLQNPDYARWVMAWSAGRTELYDVDFPSLEAMTQLGDPGATTLRQESLGAFFATYAGAGATPSEMASIRRLALDSASGYSALNLDGIALFFLESAEPDIERAPNPAQADLLLANAENAQFFLARGRLAQKTDDDSTALAMVAPVVAAYIDRARRGEAGSVEDLGPWARRLQSFVELYLSTLAADPALLAAEPLENILAAQQLLVAASASATSGRLAARLSAVDPAMVRDYQDALRDLRGTMMAAATGGDATAVGTKRAQVDALRVRIAALDPGFGANAALSIASLDALQARASGRSIVILSSLPRHLLVSTVRETGVVTKALAVPHAQIIEAIAAFRATILQEDEVSSPSGALLVSAVLSGFLDDGFLPDAVSFVVDGPFVSLPFGALPIRLGEKQSYLGAEVSLSITPSLALSSVRDNAAGSDSDKPFLGIGNAIYSAAGAQDRLGFVPTEIRETGTELRFLGALLGADIATDLLLGSDASEAAIARMSVQDALSKYRIIAFATHGFIGNTGKLQEAGLLLSEPTSGDTTQDGVLSVSEIYGLKLAADLVILSACDTGAVTDRNRGLSDLAQAFTYAGAKGLIVTHWAVDTYAATELSKRLATEMRGPSQESPADAFRAVVRSLLADPAASAFHHPKYWASHAVVGP